MRTFGFSVEGVSDEGGRQVLIGRCVDGPLRVNDRFSRAERWALVKAVDRWSSRTVDTRPVSVAVLEIRAHGGVLAEADRGLAAHVLVEPLAPADRVRLGEVLVGAQGDAPPGAAGDWTLVDCELYRDGGSYGAVLASGGQPVALFLQVLPWDTPSQRRHGSLLVSTGSDPRHAERPLTWGSLSEAGWIAALARCRRDAAPREAQERLAEMLRALRDRE